ncbi:MAG TPA: PqiC family protein [Myxococcota bacterium]|nr:PqiC family protein [Myxococcota bacterium]
MGPCMDRGGRPQRRSAAALVAGSLALLALAGCLGRSPRVRSFVLGSEGLPPAAARAPEAAIVVGPVRLPTYLDRPQLARLGASGEVRLDERNRWLGGFEENFLRGVANGLASQLGSSRVVTHPSRAPFPFDYRVRFHVDELIRDAEGSLRVRVRWVLLRDGGEAVGPIEVLEERLVVAGEGSAPLVEAHARVCALLATRIADRIVELGAGRDVGGGTGPDVEAGTDLPVGAAIDSGEGPR